jgi:hypothetical protein
MFSCIPLFLADEERKIFAARLLLEAVVSWEKSYRKERKEQKKGGSNIYL